MTGLICLWYGAIVDIPPGWTLCDGTAGTPDLRDRFIFGAGLSKNPGDRGGSILHTHTFTGDGHSHSLPAGIGIAVAGPFHHVTTIVPATGLTDPFPTFPEYHALVWIMKL